MVEPGAVKRAKDNAVKAFIADRDARNEALQARKELTKRCVIANSVGVSDQQLANAFKRAADDGIALSRTRIQQLRQKESQ